MDTSLVSDDESDGLSDIDDVEVRSLLYLPIDLYLIVDYVFLMRGVYMPHKDFQLGAGVEQYMPFMYLQLSYEYLYSL